MSFDPIEVVEHAYRLDLDEQRWLDAIAASARAGLDDGLGTLAFITEIDEQGRVVPRTFACDSPEPELLVSKTQQMNLEMSPLQRDATYRSQAPFATVSELVERDPQLSSLEDDPIWKEHAHPFGFHDLLAMHIADPSGTHIIVSTPLSEIRETTPSEREHWGRMAAHIAAGARLRYALGREPAETESLDEADAILHPDGTLAHARGDVAESTKMREALRGAARFIDRARGSMRREAPDEALELWEGLVRGRWSLVDHFDTDGRRYLVARQNDPGAEGPEKLTRRERQVVGYVALGHSNKLVAYELGLSVSTISTHLHRAMKKLGIDSRVELVRLYHALVEESRREETSGSADGRRAAPPAPTPG